MSDEHFVDLKVANDDGAVVHFRAKTDGHLRKLKADYCAKQGIDFGHAKFTYEGSVISDDDTPASLEMVTGETIHVHVSH